MRYQATATVGVPPAEVWRLFVDVESWPETHRNVTEVRRTDTGPLHVGSEAIVKQPGLPRARWRVTEIEPDRSFTWETRTGLVTSVGSHLAEPDGAGSKITISLTLRGPLAGVTARLFGRRTQRSVSMEAEGFRAAAESASRRTS
jgi:uncharacterized membrane protein